MSAIHTGSIAVRIVNGRAQFLGESHDHAVTGWDRFETRDTQSRIPARRAGNAYDTAVLMTAGCAACGCACTSGPACGHTCCCSYEPAVAATALIGGSR